MRTYLAKKEEVKRGWVIIDVKDKVLGRAATAIANILRGKHRPTFTPNVDTGDYVVVINARHVKLTGKKWDEKMYYRHSAYMGNMKEMTALELKNKRPEALVINAVKGMLPQTYLGKKILKKLKVYPGAEHPHSAGKPVEVNIC